MPKSPAPKPDQTTFPEGSRIDRKHRHSLQPKPVTELPPSALRHTQSHRYDSGVRKKKKSLPPPQISSIMESENSDDELEKGAVVKLDKTKASVVYENEKKSAKTPGKVKVKDGTSKSAFVFENPAFEGSMQAKRNSAANSSRAPSVQSLEIMREQYCCCAKRTKCERTLLTIVIVFGIIIVVLVIVIIFVAKQDEIRDLRRQLSL